MSPSSYGGPPGVLTPTHSVSSHGQIAPQTPQLATPADFLQFGQSRPQSSNMTMCGTNGDLNMAMHQSPQHHNGTTGAAQIGFWDDMMWDTNFEQVDTTGQEYITSNEPPRSWSGVVNSNDGGAQWQFARENAWARRQ
jgi:hypothetical protein